MATQQVLTKISLPVDLFRDVKKLAEKEGRTMNELASEALRVYFDKIRTFPVYTPTTRELRAIEKGREEMKRGEYLTLDELFHHLDVDSNNKKARSKSSHARSTPRARTASRRT